MGEELYGIFQKTSKDYNSSNWLYFYCVDSWAYDVTFADKIGKL